MRFRGAILIVVFVAAAFAPPKGPGDQERLAGIVELLVREALLVRDGALDMRVETSSFAERLRWSPEPVAVLAAIVRPQHADPFVDAYVRWQLTGLAGDGSAGIGLDDKLAGQLLDHLPRPVDNPRAESRFVARLERAAGFGPLPPAELQRVRSEIAAVEAAAAEADALNRATDGFHAWVEQRLGEQWRPILLSARLAACVAGGWPSTRAKADLTRSFSEGPGPAGPLRRRLEASLQRLTGTQRRSLEQVTFLADGSIRVDLATAAVSAADVERWMKLLGGEPPP